MHLPRLLSILYLTSASAIGADGPPAYEGSKFFRDQVLPIFKKRCFECHSNEQSVKGGLALDSRSGWENGGDGGPAVTPGNLKTSRLIYAIRHHDSDSAMPPDEKLPPIEIALLETWVLLGAPDPRAEHTAAAHAKNASPPAKPPIPIMPRQ